MSIRHSAYRFHEPLLPEESETQTVGCRHTNPHACSKHSLRRVCAFVREDGLCLAPRRTWPAQYRKLKMAQDGIAPDQPAATSPLESDVE